MIAGVVVLPLLLSLGSGGAPVREVLASPSFVRIATFTLKQALLSTVLALIVGLPAAFYFARSDNLLSRLLGLTTYIPFFFPGISMAIGFLSVYGRSGLINSVLSLLGLGRVQILYSFWAILLGHVFYNAPILVLVLGNALKRVPSELIETAKLDGAGRGSLFSLELRLVYPALINSILLIFSYCFTSFAVVLILGGAQYATLEVSIYMYFKLFAKAPEAIVLALVQFLFILFFGVLLSLSERRVTFEYGERYIEKGRTGTVYAFFFLFFEWVPILGALFSSLYDWGRKEFVFSKIAKLFSGRVALLGTALINTLMNSLVLSFIASILTVSLAFTLVWQSRKSTAGSKYLRLVSLLTLSVTPSILAISYLIVFDFLPVPVLMVLLYSVLALPVALNFISGQIETTQLNFLEAAELDGASRLTKLRYMIIPFFRPTLYYAGTIVFAISMGEFGGSLILGAQSFPTFAVAIYRLNGSRYLLEARFLSSLLGLIVMGVAALSQRLAFRDE